MSTKPVLETIREVSDPSACCDPIVTSPLTEAGAVDLAHAFAALSDPTRLRLYSLVASTEEICSCDLVPLLDRSQPTVSHHTKTLADAGLISGEKRGRWVYWRANPEARDALQRALGDGPAPARRG